MITSDSGSPSSTGTRPYGGFSSRSHCGRSERSTSVTSCSMPFSASAMRTRAQYGQRVASIELHPSSPISAAICS